MANKNLMSSFSNAFLFNALIKLSGIAKVSFILGSHAAFFSASMILVPLSGAFAGVAGSFAFFGVRLAISLLWTAVLPFHFFAYHIPGLFASLFWATDSKLFRIVPAIICMTLFLMHPVGSGAALYSLFWLIPVITTLFFKETYFTIALGSTFTAHAVGSVIWLYTVPMTADQWLMLIPLVIVERLLFASGMVIAYKVMRSILLKINVPLKKSVTVNAH